MLKGIFQFNEMIQSFWAATEQLTRELDHSKNDKKNLDSIWGNSKNSVQIWSDSEDFQAQHKTNLEKIWGKRN